MGPFITIVFFAFYYAFFDIDFGLKGNILGSMGATAGVTICVTAILYKMDNYISIGWGLNFWAK